MALASATEAVGGRPSDRKSRESLRFTQFSAWSVDRLRYRSLTGGRPRSTAMIGPIVPSWQEGPTKMLAPALKAAKDQPRPAGIARELGPLFARRASETTDEDQIGRASCREGG